MILRRLAQAIRRQDWFIVLIETGIVVFGVFIGLQVNNWNEARLDERRADVARERLVMDFRTIERESLEALQNTVDGVLALDRIARAWIRDPASLADVAQAARASSAFTRRGPVQFSATYRELIAAGELGLLKSESLRRALSAYERNDRVFLLASSTLATELGNADILPPLSSTMEVLATVQGDATTRDVAALRDQIRALAQAPGTLGELMAAREGLRTHLIFHQRTLQSARDILTLLGVDPSEEAAPDLPAWAAREEGGP